MIGGGNALCLALEPGSFAISLKTILPKFNPQR